MLGATGVQGPDWAFPMPASGPAHGPPSGVGRRFSLPGARGAHTAAEIQNTSLPVDWYPDDHAPMPAQVARAQAPGGWACAYCHMPGGQGRPENAVLAGLHADYIVRQLQAFHAGTRSGARPGWTPTALMIGVAVSARPADVAVAARYFSRERFVSRVRVVEAALAPSAEPAFGVWRRTGARTQPLGQRILTMPDNYDAFELRDGRATFTAFVPPGSVAAGAALAQSGGPARQPCASCHGVGLAGGLGPPLAGRFPDYVYRQLLAFRGNGRQGREAAPMRAIASRLTDPQMIALAGYAASLKPVVLGR